MADFLNPEAIVSSLGTIGVVITLFIEVGLLVGIVLPGDSLLFVAGLAAGTDALGVQLSLTALLIFCPIAAFLGAELGYYIGVRYGRSLFDRPDGRIFNQERVRYAEHWFNRYGPGKAIIFGRYVPIVRTLMSPLAGILRMDKKKFTFWNGLSAVIWTTSILIVGYLLGERVSGSIDKYLLPIVGLLIVLSLIPVLREVLKKKK
ncbi:MAG: DedA family protein [Actinobacteria bacterium]|nr:DedA family protein [Actinomycetota bacterium]